MTDNDQWKKYAVWAAEIAVILTVIIVLLALTVGA